MFSCLRYLLLVYLAITKKFIFIDQSIIKNLQFTQGNKRSRLFSSYDWLWKHKHELSHVSHHKVSVGVLEFIKILLKNDKILQAWAYVIYVN